MHFFVDGAWNYSILTAVSGKIQREGISRSNIVVDAKTHARLKAATAGSGLKMGFVAGLAINDWLDGEDYMKPARSRRIRE